jgi:hypothetical protein
MAAWEQYRVALEQEELYRKRCYEKLQKIKEYLKTLKEEEADIRRNVDKIAARNQFQKRGGEI